MLIKVECWCKSDYRWVKVNLATLTCLEYYQIVDIGVAHSGCIINCKNNAFEQMLQIATINSE